MSFKDIPDELKNSLYIATGRFISEFGSIEEAIGLILRNGNKSVPFQTCVRDLQSFSLRSHLAESTLLEKIEVSKQAAVSALFEEIRTIAVSRNIVAHNGMCIEFSFDKEEVTITAVELGVSKREKRLLSTKNILKLADRTQSLCDLLLNIIPIDLYDSAEKEVAINKGIGSHRKK